MIEIGSGFSTLISARVNQDELGGSMHLVCVEPNPRPFLVDGVAGLSELRVEKVQNTPLELFEMLEANDLLFIDTSHVAKIGSDVVWLFQEVVPRLRPGVTVHVHDFFAPADYPAPWVLDGWGWNELYLVRAFLAFNSAFKIELAAQYMLGRHPEALLKAFPEAFEGPFGGSGSSLWLRRYS
jgi:hypothetical protein